MLTASDVVVAKSGYTGETTTWHLRRIIQIGSYYDRYLNSGGRTSRSFDPKGPSDQGYPEAGSFFPCISSQEGDVIWWKIIFE